MNPFDLNDMPDISSILDMDNPKSGLEPEVVEPLIPQGLEFSQQATPTAPMGAAPAAPVEPRPQPAPAAKATGGYSSLTQSQSSSQDSRADSLFGG